MSEYTIETRRRSRSKTPFLRSACDQENCDHVDENGHHIPHQPQPKKKNAATKTQTIVEEVIEVTSSSTTPPKQSRQIQQIKTKTSDYSSEDTSPESKVKRAQSVASALAAASSSSSSSTTKQTTITTKSTSSSSSANTISGQSKRFNNSLISNTAATSTPKSNYMSDSFSGRFGSADAAESRRHRVMESTQNVLNAQKEAETSAHSNRSNRSKRSSHNNSLSRLFGESFDTSTADLSDHVAYLEYKRVGEYWNKTPKTDYTYSEFSPHRRFLAPGVVAMPNMSRRSLENYGDRAHLMQHYEQENYKRNYYETTRKSKTNEKLLYESGDELDYIGHRKQQQSSSWLTRIITTIVTTITTITSGGAADRHASLNKRSAYGTYVGAGNRGFFGSITHGISSAAAAIWHYLSVAVLSVLTFDTWLLQSNSENRNRKRFLLFLLLLLPLLLLGGLFYYLHPNESFPPKALKEYTFTLPQLQLQLPSLPALPALRDIDMSKFVKPEQLDAFKAQAYRNYIDIRDWADDYWLYVRTVTQNLADETRKLFRREQYYERV